MSNAVHRSLDRELKIASVVDLLETMMKEIKDENDECHFLEIYSGLVQALLRPDSWTWLVGNVHLTEILRPIIEFTKKNDIEARLMVSRVIEQISKEVTKYYSGKHFGQAAAIAHDSMKEKHAGE